VTDSGSVSFDAGEVRKDLGGFPRAKEVHLLSLRVVSKQYLMRCRMYMRAVLLSPKGVAVASTGSVLQCKRLLRCEVLTWGERMRSN
jgi:hypothetical protein